MNSAEHSSPEEQDVDGNARAQWGRQTTIVKTAGQWLARRDRGLTAAEQDEFLTWLGSDPRHGAALHELEAPFRAMDRAAVLRPAGRTEPDADLLAADGAYPLAGKSSARRFRGRMLAFCSTFAAAAAIVIGFVTFRNSTSQDTPVSVHGSLIWNEPERRVLPDGTEVELRPATPMEITFSANERRVRLGKGEAHFTVTKDPQRPFVVIAGNVAVRAVGTAFNVRSDAAEVEVVVTEGTVRVDDAVHGKSLLDSTESSTPAGASDPLSHVTRAAAVAPSVMAAGHRVTIALSSSTRSPAPVMAIAPGQIDHALAWRGVWLEFVDVPLADVTQEFNRRNGSRLQIADEATGRLLVSGTFRGDGEDAFVRLLAAGFGVTSTTEAQGVRLLRKVP